MDEQAAVNYLRRRCLVDDLSDIELRQRWREARDRLGPPIPNAGRCDVRDIPSAYLEYLRGVVAQQPRFQETTAGLPWHFKLVEIDPLLSFQFHVAIDGPASQRERRGAPPSVQDLLLACLPHAYEDVPWRLEHFGNDVWIRSRSPNLRLYGPELLQRVRPGTGLAGITFGACSPLVQVVRHRDRYYLKNGFHRAYHLRGAGATHLPCLLLEASDYAQLGARRGFTFDRALLESDNPPTCGHFTQDRAAPVMLRDVTRIIHLTWAEYAFPDEAS